MEGITMSCTKYQIIPSKNKQSTSNFVLDFSPSWNVSVDRITFVYVIISTWHYSSVWGGEGIYIFTNKKRWKKIHKSKCTYTKLQVEKLFIYIPITLLWKCTPDSTQNSTPNSTPKLHTKTPFQTPHQSYTPDSTTKLHSRLYDKTPFHTPRQISTSDSTTKLHSRLHTKTPLFKLHGDVSLPFRGISFN